MSADSPKTFGIYRGWLVTIGAFLATMFATMAHTAFGLYAVPAAEEFNLSYADANTWLIVASLASAAIAPFAGRLIDKVSIRAIMIVGGALFALTFNAIALSQSLMLILFLAIPVAIAGDAAGAMAGATATARWFRRRRGRALAFAAIASSASGFALAPLAAYLITAYSWRTALSVMGVLAGAIIVACAIVLIRTRPTEQQLREAGELIETDNEEVKQAEQRVWSFREVVTNRNFLLLSFGIGLLFASDRAVMASIAPYLHDGGIDLQKAGFLVSALMGSSIAGKLIVGYVADYVDPRKIFLVVALLHLVLLGMFIVQPAFWVMMVIAMVLGVGLGGVLPTNQVLIASVFGSNSFGTVTGAATLVHQVLMMGTLRLIGEVRDRTGSYDLGFQIFIGIVVVATILIWNLSIPGRPRGWGTRRILVEA